MQIQQMILGFYTAIDIMIKLIYRGQYFKDARRRKMPVDSHIFIWSFQLKILKPKRISIVTSLDVAYVL